MTTNETDQSAADKVQRTAFMDLLEAAKGVIAGFDSGVFVRNVDHDHEPGWTVKAQPSLLALGNMASPRRGIPIQSMSSFFGVLRRRKYFKPSCSELRGRAVSVSSQLHAVPH